VTLAGLQVLQYRYGHHPSQFARLYLPEGNWLAVAVVIHGGFWRDQRGIEAADPLAEDLTAYGVAALTVEYRRVGNGGGWPTTMADVARATDELAYSGQVLAQGRLRLDRVSAIGHSAGGQLAAWLAHRESLRHGTAGSLSAVDPGIRLHAAVSQAGVLDLVAGSAERLGNGAVDVLMDGSPGSVPQRYHHSNPMAHIGDGARVVCVHGDRDTVVPIGHSERYVAAARAAGDPARMVWLPGIGHDELVEPGHVGWQISRDALLQEM
jgi:acetyl esterase/lipase